MKNRKIEIGTTKHRRKRSIPSSVNELLARDDVNRIVRDLENIRPSIEDIIVIYVDRDTQEWHYLCNGEILHSTAVWLLESVKHDFIVGDSEDYDE